MALQRAENGLLIVGHGTQEPQGIEDFLEVVGQAEQMLPDLVEALQGRREVPPDETALVLVGRGGRDLGAVAEMQRFAELRQRLTPVARLEVGFLAMTQPTLAQVLASVAQGPIRRTVVQPHLLFPGQLIQTARQAVDEIRAQNPRIDWVVAGPLGPDPALAEAVVAMVRRGAPARRTPQK